MPDTTIMEPIFDSSFAVRSLDAIWVIARRGIRDLVRVPAAFFPSIMVPLFFYLIYSAGIGPLASRAGVAVAGNYHGFVLATIMFLSVTNSASAAGFAVVRDIESGYFDKLLLTPAPRATLVFGRLLADGMRAALATTLILTVGLLTGAGLAAGPLGFVVLVLLATGWSVVWAGVALTIALRTGSLDATQLAFFIGFPMVFLSPAFGPRALLTGWIRPLSALNPVTYLIEASRHLILVGWDSAALGKAALSVVIVGSITLTLATSALHHRARANN
ncbi:MAG: ABC transporter permease [Thermoleophilia bacterium]|nr:ABC transporter permease [Thermoleophilia bacterium]